jgi:imidazolonepropionase-like amidohydrolase
MMFLLPRFRFLLLLFFLCGCKPPTEETHMKAIIGAVLFDGSGGPPITNSVVVVAGNHISAAGAPATVPIPALADKIDGAGRFLVPVPVDIYDGAANKVPGVVHLFQQDEAEIEKARDAHLAIIGHISTLAAARWMVDNGATALVGMIRDTEAIDPDFLAKLRDLKIHVAPALLQAGPDLALAQRNTLRLFRAGVPIALATGGGDPYREAELLSDSGIPPMDVIAAMTHNSSAALRQSEGRANLLLLSANPAEDIRNLRKVALRLSDGEIAR